MCIRDRLTSIYVIVSGGKDSLILSERALVFVENHLTQRGQGFEGAKSLSFKQAKRYTVSFLV